jgi:hypothetical protein
MLPETGNSTKDEKGDYGSRKGPFVDNEGQWRGPNGARMKKPSFNFIPENTLRVSPARPGVVGGLGGAADLLGQLQDFMNQLGEVGALANGAVIRNALPQICKIQRYSEFSPMRDGCGCCITTMIYRLKYPGGLGRNGATAPWGPPTAIITADAQYVPKSCNSLGNTGWDFRSYSYDSFTEQRIVKKTPM